MTSRKFRSLALAAPGIALFIWAMASVTAPLPGRAQEAGAAAAPSALDALPADTTFLIRLRSVSDLTKKFKTSPFYALKEHPDLKKLIEDTKKKMDEGLSEARGKLGFDPMDIFDQVDGEILLAVGGLDKIAAALAAEMSGGEANVSPGDLPLILAVDAGASAPKLRESIAKILEFAQKEGAKKSVEDFRGGKITTLLDEGPGKENEGIKKVYFGDMGSRVLVSVNRPYLEQTMANLTAPAQDALVKSADFLATQREIKGDADFTIFLNIRPIAAAARKNLQANPMAAMVWGIVEGKVLGRSLKNLGISATLRENGLQQLSFVNNGGGSDGIFGIFKGQPFSGKPSSLIPEDVDEFSSLSLNVPALYATIKDIYSMAAPLMQMGGGGPPGGPGGMPDFDQFIEGQFQIKMKPVIESIGNILHVYQKGEIAGPMAMGLPSFTLALELKDEMPIKELLDKLLAMGGIKSQKYLDRDFYPFGGGEEGPALAIADKHLVFAMTGDLAKELVRRAGKGGKGVGDTPGYQSLAGMIPSQVSMLSYSSGKSFQGMLKTLKDAFARSGAGSFPDLTALGDVFAGNIGFAQWKDQGLSGESLFLFKKGGGTVPREAPPGDK